MGKLFGTGINQGDLVDLIASIRTKFNALLTKLDADSVIAATDYNSTCAVSIPEGIQTTGAKAILDQGQIVTFLNDLVTNYNAALAKVDADAGAGIDNDYVSTLGLTDIVGNDKIDAIFNAGVDQGAVVYLLNAFITNFNLVLTKLDTDPLGDSDYSSTLAITDTVDEAGTKGRLHSIIGFVLLASSILCSGFAAAMPRSDFNGDVVNSTICYTKRVAIDAGKFDTISLQAVYAAGSPSTMVVYDGRKSTNTITIVSTTSISGKYLTINGVTLTAGTDFSVANTASGTAVNLMNALNANATFASFATATWQTAGAIVFTTATSVGVNAYACTVNTSSITFGASTFQNGLAPTVSNSTDEFYSDDHQYETGLDVYLASASATSPIGGLTANTTYFVYKTRDDYFKLATTEANAVAGTAIDISTLTGSNSWTLTPVTYSGATGNGLDLQASNDGTNWTRLSITSHTYTAAGSSIWDLSTFNYRYLGLYFLAPTRGGIAYKVIMRGKGQ